MDASLSDQDRAQLKADAIARLRNLEADLERSHEIHRDTLQQRGEQLLRPPIDHELFVNAVRDLRRAGVDVPDWYIQPPNLISQRQGKRGRKMDWINATALLSDIKAVLARVDPNPE